MDEEENDVVESMPNQSSNGEGTRKARRVIKNKFAKLSKSSSIIAFFSTPLGWVILGIIILILVIVLITGFIGFFETMPGLAKEKISQFYHNAIAGLNRMLWEDPTDDPLIEIDESQKVDLANYIESLGYDIVGYGFLDSTSIESRKEDGTIEKLKAPEDEYSKDYLYAYLLANERTYALQNYKKTGWSKFRRVVKTLVFMPFFYYDTVVDLFMPKDPHEEARHGMIDVEDWAHGLGSEIFDAMYIERDQDNYNNVKLVVKRWNNNATWYNPFTWGEIFNVDTFSWDMDGWTPRYGKPIELSLALHLSTMAPDLAYDFCMNDDLQAVVKIDTVDMTYNAIYTYQKDDKVLDEEKVNELYESVKEQMETYKYFENIDYEGNDIKDNGYSYYCPIECFDNVSAVYIVANGASGSDRAIKGITKEGEIISFFDSDGNPEFANNGYVIISNGIVKSSHPDVDEERNTIARGGPVYFASGAMNARIFVLSLEDCIELTSRGSDMKDGELDLLKKTLDRMQTCAEHSVDEFIKQMGDSVSWKYQTFKEEKDGEIIEFSNYSNAFDTASRFLFDYKDYDYANYLLQIIKDDINEDIRVGKEEWPKYVEENAQELKDNNLTFKELEALHIIFNDASKELKTYQPYISYVRNHWYKDVIFELGDVNRRANESVDGEFDLGLDDQESPYEEDLREKYGYDYVSEETKKAIKELKEANYYIYSYGDRSVTTMPFQPEGLAAELNEEEWNYINSLKGQVSVELTPQTPQVVQLNQPLVVSNEKHHLMFKAWLQQGYFLIYDGNPNTAEQIKAVRKYLSQNTSYDSEDPLLGIEGTSNEDNDRRDMQAKSINRMLDMAENNGILEKTGIRLKKISFDKGPALAAFSILESVHTRDAEYVYRDLKELMIELEYFTREDFATIELGVLEWLLPDYKPQNWPMKQYEKNDTSYETLILSKAHVQEIRKSLKKEDGEDTEETEESEKEYNIFETTENKNESDIFTCDGFEGGNQVIVPEDCKVIKIEASNRNADEIYGETGVDLSEIKAVTLKFTSANKVKDFTLKIDGIVLNPNVEIKKGTELSKKDLLGYTVEGVDIKLLMKDHIKAVVNNVEDYMTPKRRKNTSLNSDYAKLYFIPYEGLSFNVGGPDCMGTPNDNEIAFGICQWTLVYSKKSDYLTPFLKGMVDLDPAFCSGLNAYTCMSFDELWQNAEGIHTVLQNMAKKDKQYLIDLEMTYALQTLEERTRNRNADWILEKSDAVIGTYFSCLNWRPGVNWEKNINKNMSDEDIIMQLARTWLQEDSSYIGRMDSQAKFAVDMLTDSSIDPKEFCEEGFKNEKYSKYDNGLNSGYLKEKGYW